MISIIIPIYNVEKYLRQCLDSVANQTYPDWEAILVDDGSSDGSPAICDEYAQKDGRFRVVHQANAGVSHARNCGLEMAKGTVVSFVDADDWLDAHFYEKLLPMMATSDLLYVSDVHHYTDGTRVAHVAPAKRLEGSDEVERMLLYLKNNDACYPFFGFTWNKLFRADIILQHHLRFIEDLTLCEDEAFTDDYCKFINSLTIVSEPLYHYRASLNGLTHKQKEESEYLLLINHVLKIMNNYTYKPLANYEQKRILDLSLSCIRGGVCKNYRKEIELLKLCDSLPAAQIGRRAKLVLFLGPPGRLLVRLYQFVFRQHFI